MKGKTAFIITFSLIGASLIMVIVSIALTPEIPWENRDNSASAYYMILEFVKDSLKAPSTAEFPNIRDIVITKKEFTYSISGYVDAQNSFGAMIRTRYNGEIKQVDKDKWELMKLDFAN